MLFISECQGNFLGTQEGVYMKQTCSYLLCREGIEWVEKSLATVGPVTCDFLRITALSESPNQILRGKHSHIQNLKVFHASIQKAPLHNMEVTTLRHNLKTIPYCGVLGHISPLLNSASHNLLLFIPEEFFLSSSIICSWTALSAFILIKGLKKYPIENEG